MSEYKPVEDYRSWKIWQRNGQPDLVGNMKLETEIKGVDTPDLKADIDEAMISRLGAFEAKIVAGNPPAVPPPTPLTAAEKSTALRTIGYMETNIGYLQRSTQANVPMTEKVTTITQTVSTLKAEVIADPPIPRVTRNHIRRNTASRRSTRPITNHSHTPKRKTASIISRR